MPTIFLSYSRQDAAFVAELEKRLCAGGWSVWRDVHSLRAGDRWPRKLGEAIAGCEALLLIWSNTAAHSDFVELEWTIAVAMKRQIGILVLDREPLPATLRPYQALEASEADTAVDWLMRGLIPERAPAAAVEPVLQKLDATAQTEPSQVTAGLRIAFSQPGWKIDGPVYQSGGDMHVYLGEPKPSRKTTYLVTTVIALVIAVAVYMQRTGVFRHNNGEVAADPKSENTVVQPFGGFVQDEDGRPLEGVKMTAPNLGIETMTDSLGRFSFQVPVAAGANFRLVAQKPGYDVFTADPTSGNTAFNCHLTRRSGNLR